MPDAVLDKWSKENGLADFSPEGMDRYYAHVEKHMSVEEVPLSMRSRSTEIFGEGAAKLGRPVPTIDLRVDFHKAAMPGDLTAKARVVRMGSQYSTAEASVYDTEGSLVASGRGTYFTAPLK